MQNTLRDRKRAGEFQPEEDGLTGLPESRKAGPDRALYRCSCCRRFVPEYALHDARDVTLAGIETKDWICGDCLADSFRVEQAEAWNKTNPGKRQRRIHGTPRRRFGKGEWSQGVTKRNNRRNTGQVGNDV